MTRTAPPARDGISPSKLYLPKITPTPVSIFAYLCDKFAHISMDEWQVRFGDGLVVDGDGKRLTIDTPYQQGMTIYYYKSLAYEVPVPFEHHIIYENDALLVVDKPHFLTVTPSGRYVVQTLLTRLKRQFDNTDISPIHRLDRETAGLILFAKTPSARSAYQVLFATRAMTKTYHAIAPYSSSLQFPLSLALNLERGEPFYTMQVGQGAPNTQTDIDIIAVSDDKHFAKYELKPSTGKLHQLRVHMNHLGIAIVHDSFYPVVAHAADDDFSRPLQLLAKRLEFIDPLTGEMMAFESHFELDLAQIATELG